MGTCDTATLAVTGRRVPERATGADAPTPAPVAAARSAAPDLAAALRALARALRREAHVEVRASGAARPLAPDAAEALLRAVRVAAAGAVRHGRASLVTVTVTYAPGAVRAVVRDDGAGPGARPDGLALRLPRRRLEELGGGLEVGCGRHAGAVVRAWVGA
jgi:signal transduction histidine kinase